jgi:hypothetical protein
MFVPLLLFAYMMTQSCIYGCVGLALGPLLLLLLLMAAAVAAVAAA